MIHFARQMEAYCRLEVIECSWINLMEFLNKKEGDLDALIEAHRIYLDRVVKKIFLLSTKVGKEVCIIIPDCQCVSTCSFRKIYSKKCGRFLELYSNSG